MKNAEHALTSKTQIYPLGEYNKTLTHYCIENSLWGGAISLL